MEKNYGTYETLINWIISTPMVSPEECFHPELTFGSGDYYIFCNRCGRKWATMGDQLEYGHDSQGQPIGADPLKANKLKDFTKLHQNRVLLVHD